MTRGGGRVHVERTSLLLPAPDSDPAGNEALNARTAADRLDSFRFRLLVEPSAILEPGYELPLDWAGEMAARHHAFLLTRWTRAASAAFFEMDAAFHEGIAKASGNRFFHEAIARLNRLRRLSSPEWNPARERVRASCQEHLQILGWLQAGDVGVAALLMRQHLEQARLVRSR